MHATPVGATATAVAAPPALAAMIAATAARERPWREQRQWEWRRGKWQQQQHPQQQQRGAYYVAPLPPPPFFCLFFLVIF